MGKTLTLTGTTGAIGIFFWATGSDIDRRVGPGVSSHGIVQAFNMSTAADVIR